MRLPSFGNLPPSSAVKAGGFPTSVEEQQLRIFEEPEWASSTPDNLSRDNLSQVYQTHVF